MPLPKGTTFRVQKTKHGKKVRLAWYKGNLIEAKNPQTGDTTRVAPRKVSATRKTRKRHSNKSGGK